MKQRRCTRCGRFVSNDQSYSFCFNCKAEFENRNRIKRYELIITILGAILSGIVFHLIFGG